MSNKQARLVSAIADAMKDQGFSQGNLARMSGVSQSMISAALLGKYDPKEEKWRLLCESLALDYDEIVSEPDSPQEKPAEETMSAAVCENHVETALSDQPSATSPQRPALSDQPSATSPQREVHRCIVAEYLSSKLREDLMQGTDMTLAELYVLLTHIKELETEGL